MAESQNKQENLQHLLDRIRQDGVEKADAQAADIIAKAKAQAADIVKNAKQEAAQAETKARETAESYEQRSRQALRQAARDVVQSVSGAVTALLERLLEAGTGQALDDALLVELVSGVVQRYAEADAAGKRFEIGVNPEQAEAVARGLAGKLAADLREGVTVEPRGDIVRGFRVAIKDRHIEHEFTAEAIADALGELVRPELAKLLKDPDAA